jgi:hypothetical protein
MTETSETVELRDGTRALIRPIGPGDRDRLKKGFESASPESIFLRFLSPLPRLSGSQLDYLTAIGSRSPRGADRGRSRNRRELRHRPIRPQR